MAFKDMNEAIEEFRDIDGQVCEFSQSEQFSVRGTLAVYRNFFGQRKVKSVAAGICLALSFRVIECRMANWRDIRKIAEHLSEEFKNLKTAHAESPGMQRAKPGGVRGKSLSVFGNAVADPDALCNKVLRGKQLFLYAAYGRDGGHAFAFDTTTHESQYRAGRQNVLFFDPNVGIFFKQDMEAEKFKNWFKNYWNTRLDRVSYQTMFQDGSRFLFRYGVGNVRYQLPHDVVVCSRNM